MSGTEKLVSPYQNFLYVIQSYDVFPVIAEKAAAHIVPWLELFLGIFIIIGLWLKQCLKALSVLITGFILIVSQALIRGLPIDECGCFGERLSLPLTTVLLMDSILLVVVGTMILWYRKASVFGLDNYFQKSI